MNNRNKKCFLFFYLPLLLISSSSFAMLTSSTKKSRMILAKKIKSINQITAIASIDKEIDTLKNNIYEEYLKEIQHITNESYTSWHRDLTTQRAHIKKALQNQICHQPRIHGTNFPPICMKISLPQ